MADGAVCAVHRFQQVQVPGQDDHGVHDVWPGVASDTEPRERCCYHGAEMHGYWGHVRVFERFAVPALPPSPRALVSAAARILRIEVM